MKTPQTVVETAHFQKRAAAIGLDEATIDLIKTTISRNPAFGDAMQGTGGFRKGRFALPGRGKSGGVRTVHFFSGDTMPVFLIDVFSKGQKANLTQAERNALKSVAVAIKKEYAK
ncbi:type II toxin-antitoxin system RelE/ParE family toxin [Pyruvatibacter mobilis]|uniref:Type II toxin-antitoxin system RelE/ParE family toxin n=1 Tax=Pyruvatibacter mobilis TaxID=1712261 RepID=A0A845QAC0_9HYPH|nr:type II toxin-antitoxin system RelE/ParE family toxin [Pyruvatibacter mobilis]NBG95309.1 type II toxin-antitoxin system RelE/ParE family toxin [Pyruvatibacter mobilis]QJD75595.1 type II toxin-antitoxin system RelE/ParE family toxin [Pyruvatibacter mobilis]GGD16893.1 toxin RelE [Pyruvatibacter mobilis]